MEWVSAIGTEDNLEQAVLTATGRIRQQLHDQSPDLLLAFVSHYAEDELRRLPALLENQVGPKRVLGCTSGGVIGAGQEVEHRPALSLTAAVLPGVQIQAFHLESADLPQVGLRPKDWESLVCASVTNQPNFLLLPDPYTFDIDTLVRGLDLSFPGSTKIGGLASGGTQKGGNLLFFNREIFSSGMIGASLWGDLQVDTIVAQGCRPIGMPMFITACQRNVLQALDGHPVSQILQNLYNCLDPRDQQLFSHSLFLGIVMKDNQKEYRPGDFLIRNILGLAQDRESLVVGAPLKENQVVQFHLRDAKTSSEDLHHLLMRYKTEHLEGPKPAGALLFSCLGRGVHLFGEPNHDSKTFQRFLGDTPLGGFFCNGEIGPVHGRTFLHGYTSAFWIFRKGA